MSDDLIRRSDAIKAAENVSENYTKEGDREWHPHIDFITQALVQVPSVPPKQGEWIYIDEPIIGNPYGRYKCSKCNLEEPFESNFCPNCGARMYGEAKESE